MSTSPLNSIEHSTLTCKRFWYLSVLLPFLTLLGQVMTVWSAPRSLGGVAVVMATVSGASVPFLIAAIPALVYYAFTAFAHRRNRPDSHARISKSLACLCFICCFILALGASNRCRHQEFVKASKVGGRIVEALAKYKIDMGEYPENLDQLIPRYLKEIPYTGMIAYPKFRYVRDYENMVPKPGEYELEIFCPRCFGNFDKFIYHPSEKYPEMLWDENLEKILGWAYLHE